MAVQAQLYPESFVGLPIYGPPDWMGNPVSGFDQPDFCFALQNPQQALYLQQQTAQNLPIDSNRGASSSSSTCCNSPLMAFSQSLDAQLEVQRREIDYFLQLHNERLSSALQEQRKQQLAVLLKSVESKVLYFMRQKEDELVQATKKSMELEACLRKAEMESKSWQRLARENEAMVMDLSNTLDQVRERLVLVSNRAEDAESSFGGSCDREEAEVKENCKKMACKHCHSRRSCVLFLPCRHLCSCKSCEAFLGSCPVCKSGKEASMEVFWV